MKTNFLLPNKGLSQKATAAQKPLMAAIAAIGAGHYDQAIGLLKSERGAALKTPVGQNVLGDAFLKQGDPAEALKAFDAAIRLTPGMPEAHCNRGVALQELGRLDDALAAEDRSLALRPEYAMAHYNRGNVLKAMERLEDAVAAYDRSLRLKPDFADAHLNRGLALLGLDRALEALASFDRALALRPRNVAAQVGRAGCFRELHQHIQALAAIDAALALEPDNLDTATMRCGILIAMEQFEDALSGADALIVRHTDASTAHIARANALQKLKRFDESLAAADEAVRRAPQAHAGHTARGIALVELGRLEEGLAALNAARDFGAADASFHEWRGVALAGYGDIEEALTELNLAVEIDPENPTGRYNRAMARLASGDLAGGFADAEWRLKLPENRSKTVDVAPLWRGEELQGKKLLITTEQGHGDTIQFVRYLPLVEETGAEITFLAQGALRRLLEANFPDVDVIDDLGFRSGFDHQISVMSLAHIFGTSLATIPQNVPYLRADPARVAKWKMRLGDGFKVGIAWQGNPKYGRDRDRSIRLAEFAPLAAVKGARFISLQAYGGIGQLATPPPGMTIETLGEEIVNNPDGFREVAAVMENLDLLVMSDTGPAHLAGALGRPIWVALMEKPDWRWMRAGDVSPWYPTMRLFRQRRAGDWPQVFSDIAAALRELAGRT